MAKEDTKFGLMPEDVMGFIDKVPEFKNVTVEGPDDDCAEYR